MSSNPIKPKENIMKCYHLNGGYCTLGHFSGRPGTSDCLKCDDYDGLSRGLGDDIAKITRAVGLEKVTGKINTFFDVNCGCRKRKEKWNEMFPHESED
tara:strand:+ start:2619 stop:2912 length:294 start_codon:yes stop_codon:yes gene_type:complete